MQALEEMLKQERDDRRQSLQDQLDPIHKGMKDQFIGLENERNGRVQKEREILDNLAEESYKIEEAI
eukprot:CAMPEP_0176365152 /NCGR_PEP_ID=MMETSP0126-20121128/20268_1 /TAXON_ID=141414 ORGANISM="Strombidinopsis acuminatum, Strain SPMC142" /NCGR_SAMPLE_ID=MMETSP0126 /ASSEMBLY_ACC=CAM_ASM_000229 /LENGTH=66 /DNA_ID=CAMNT_0017722035 /DNA_START=337 /DNA_END=537 /DNA_ORIENTATION=+